MSAPAAKALAEPVSMMQCVVGEPSKARRAELSSLMRGVESALRALGRLSVTVGGFVREIALFGREREREKGRMEERKYFDQLPGEAQLLECTRRISRAMLSSCE